jgi:hypothetical protein
MGFAWMIDDGRDVPTDTGRRASPGGRHSHRKSQRAAFGLVVSRSYQAARPLLGLRATAAARTARTGGARTAPRPDQPHVTARHRATPRPGR